ncbi:MAG: DNA/RNA nuclease SfsA [Firmicutes bacterium]|nr:DNA/RNA nuclease SfsA [Bacillota bacterium]
MEGIFISTGPALEEGIFVERPNRFLIRCALKKAVDGVDCARPRSLVEAHLPDPGRLKELLVPGRRIWLRSVNNIPRRKTKWTAVLTERPDGKGFVSLDSTLPNRLIAKALQRGVMEEFQGWSLLSAEFKMGHSRWDFLLAGPGESRLVLEVKSVTLVENGVGLFPDAITARGTRHLQELAEIAQQPDWKAAALFVLQRDDACRIEAARSIDQTFAAVLAEARAAGVGVFGRRCIVTLEKVILGERVPVVTPEEKNSLLKKYWSIPER